MCEVCVCVLVYMGTSLFYLDFSTVSSLQCIVFSISFLFVTEKKRNVLSLQCIVFSINIFFICYRDTEKSIDKIS